MVELFIYYSDTPRTFLCKKYCITVPGKKVKSGIKFKFYKAVLATSIFFHTIPKKSLVMTRDLCKTKTKTITRFSRLYFCFVC